VSLFAFLIWVQYDASVTPQEALSQSPDLAAQINPAWKAVTINHGEVSESLSGTKEQNPQGYRRASMFFILTALMSIGLGFAAVAKASDKPKWLDKESGGSQSAL
jgi:hypothetical protein